MIPASLKARLVAAAAGGALAIAGVLVHTYEGRVHVAAPDPVGVLTVCEGHTGPDIIPGKWYTDAECDQLRDKDLATADAAIDRLVTVPLNDWQRAALQDFTLNMGAGALERSTLLRKLNAGDYAGACAEYARWINAGGRRLQGLVNRREADAWVCSQQ